MNVHEPAMFTLSVLMTCYNRRAMTLACLDALMACLSKAEDIHMQIYLVDDGSTDGTGDAVRKAFPEVSVITGDGNQYWNRGMHRAWTSALVDNPDAYLWLNDDTCLFPDALTQLKACSEQENHRSVISGSTCSPNTGAWTYGGTCRGQAVLPNGSIQPCDLCHGNILWVSRHVVERIGILDPYYLHALGDYDYSQRARAALISLCVAPTYLGECALHEHAVPWTDPDVPLLQRLRNLYSPLGNAQPKYYLYYIRRHLGWAFACKAMASIHLRALFPGLWSQPR